MRKVFSKALQPVFICPFSSTPPPKVVFQSVRHGVKHRRDLNVLADYRNLGLQMNSISILMLIPTVALNYVTAENAYLFKAPYPS